MLDDAALYVDGEYEGNFQTEDEAFGYAEDKKYRGYITVVFRDGRIVEHTVKQVIAKNNDKPIEKNCPLCGKMNDVGLNCWNYETLVK